MKHFIKNCKRSFLVVSLLSFFNSRPSESVDVYLDSPDFCRRVEFNALVLKPSGANMSFAAEAIPLPAPSPNWNIFNINPAYRFAFDLGFRHILHDLNTNIFVNWQRFKSCDCAAKRVQATNMIGPFFAIGPDSIAYREAFGQMAFNFNQVNIDYGQMVNFGDRLHTNLFVGIAVTQIKQYRNTTFNGTFEATDSFPALQGPISRNIQQPICFIGAGPQCGLDFSYCIRGGLDFEGRFKTSLFVGRLANKQVFNSVSPEAPLLATPNPNVQRTFVQRTTSVVPAIEQGLGLSFTFDECCGTTVKIAAGYQVQVYFDALQSIDFESGALIDGAFDNTIGVFAETFIHSSNNFSLFGPYFSFDIAF